MKFWAGLGLLFVICFVLGMEWAIRVEEALAGE